MAPKLAARRARAKPKPALRYEPGRLILCAESLGEGVAALQALDPETIALLLEIGGPPPRPASHVNCVPASPVPLAPCAQAGTGIPMPVSADCT